MGVTVNNLHWLNLLQVCCSLFQHLIIMIMSLDTTNSELTESLYSLKFVQGLTKFVLANICFTGRSHAAVAGCSTLKAPPEELPDWNL